MTQPIQFPKHFIWGAATSCYQIEGATSADGRGESIWDRFCQKPDAVSDGSSGAVACDHYHRFEEDIALMKELNLQAYRFSIAWPRIIPGGRGAINERGLDFYERLVDALLKAGITPYPTLFHWDLPQSLEDAGGWPVRATAEAFVDYTEAVARRLGDRIDHWITHNEPWCASMLGYQRGIHAPGHSDWKLALDASHHLLLSHGLAVQALRALCPKADVGITLNVAPCIAASGSIADREAARHADGDLNRWFLDPLYGRGYPADMIADHVAAGHLPPEGLTVVQPGDLDLIKAPTDFLGLNYYFRNVVRSEAIPEEDNEPRRVVTAPEEEWTDMGWEVQAEGLWQILTRIHLDYGVDNLMITENGASFDTGLSPDGHVHDDRRLSYLQGHLAQAHRAIEDGVPLSAYFVWSLMDNFEWQCGYAQRFGVVYVDYETQKRTPKDSALWYRNVIKDNGFEPQGFDPPA